MLFFRVSQLGSNPTPDECPYFLTYFNDYVVCTRTLACRCRQLLQCFLNSQHLSNWSRGFWFITFLENNFDVSKDDDVGGGSVDKDNDDNNDDCVTKQSDCFKSQHDQTLNGLDNITNNKAEINFSNDGTAKSQNNGEINCCGSQNGGIRCCSHDSKNTLSIDDKNYQYNNAKYMRNTKRYNKQENVISMRQENSNFSPIDHLGNIEYDFSANDVLGMKQSNLDENDVFSLCTTLIESLQTDDDNLNVFLDDIMKSAKLEATTKYRRKINMELESLNYYLKNNSRSDYSKGTDYSKGIKLNFKTTKCGASNNNFSETSAFNGIDGSSIDKDLDGDSTNPNINSAESLELVCRSVWIIFWRSYHLLQSCARVAPSSEVITRSWRYIPALVTGILSKPKQTLVSLFSTAIFAGQKRRMTNDGNGADMGGILGNFKNLSIDLPSKCIPYTLWLANQLENINYIRAKAHTTLLVSSKMTLSSKANICDTKLCSVSKPSHQTSRSRAANRHRQQFSFHHSKISHSEQMKELAIFDHFLKSIEGSNLPSLVSYFFQGVQQGNILIQQYAFNHVEKLSRVETVEIESYALGVSERVAQLSAGNYALLSDSYDLLRFKLDDFILAADKNNNVTVRKNSDSFDQKYSHFTTLSDKSYIVARDNDVHSSAIHRNGNSGNSVNTNAFSQTNIEANCNTNCSNYGGKATVTSSGSAFFNTRKISASVSKFNAVRFQAAFGNMESELEKLTQEYENIRYLLIAKQSDYVSVKLMLYLLRLWCQPYAEGYKIVPKEQLKTFTRNMHRKLLSLATPLNKLIQVLLEQLHALHETNGITLPVALVIDILSNVEPEMKNIFHKLVGLVNERNRFKNYIDEILSKRNIDNANEKTKTSELNEQQTSLKKALFDLP